MSSSDVGAAALQLAVETTLNVSAIEKENERLRGELQKNLEKLRDVDTAVAHTQALQETLKAKEAELEQKRKDLIEIQSAIIGTLKAQAQEAPAAPQPSMESIPVVMNRVQKFVTDLTESAVDQKSIAIPVFSLFKVTDMLSKLYDAVVEAKIIEETDEERRQRSDAYAAAQQEILSELKQIIERAQQQAQTQEEAGAEPEPEGEPKAKVEEVKPERPPTPQGQPPEEQKEEPPVSPVAEEKPADPPAATEDAKGEEPAKPEGQ